MTNQKSPMHWQVRKYADVGTSEEFVRQFDELNRMFSGVSIAEPQREQAREATMTIMMEGLLPAFLDLRRIRESVGKDLPVLDRLQLYEDFVGKAWKSYKELMQQATLPMGFDIGFLFKKETQFESGLKKFRELNPNVPLGFEKFLRDTRMGWQNELADFRNSIIEHPNKDRKAYKDVYDPANAENLFDAVWRTIVQILAILLSFHLPRNFILVDHGSNDPTREWPHRFQFHWVDGKLS